MNRRDRRLESDFSGAFARVLRSQGAEVYPLRADERCPPGWPDRLVWHRYWHGLVELKGEETRLEPHQDDQLRRLEGIVRCSAVLVRALPKARGEQDARWPCVVEWRVADRAPATVGREVTLGTLLRTLRDWRAVHGGDAPTIENFTREDIT